MQRTAGAPPSRVVGMSRGINESLRTACTSSVQLDRGQDAFLHVYDIDSRTGSVCSAGEGFFGSQSADITWTAGNNLLLSWGAGSDVAFIHLLDRYCGELLSVGVTGYNISPDRRYLMTGPATGAPLASDHSVKIFDLESGKQIATRLDNTSTGPSSMSYGNPNR